MTNSTGSTLNIREFNVREANWSSESAVLSNIRKLVFIVEQNVPQEEEWDGRDEESWHFIATDNDDRPIGTARLLPEGQIGRMAVLKEYRGKGIGAVLLEHAIEKARHLGFTSVYLHAQTHALGFYEKAGFLAEGEEFSEADIPHMKMTQMLQPLTDNVQRKLVVEELPDFGVKEFDTREVAWSKEGGGIRLMRQAVLVGQLGLPPDTVADEVDESAIHWIAQHPETGQAIGSIRMSLDGELARLAVLPEHRHKGVGQSLIELAVGKARRFSLDLVSASAPANLEPLFSACGFDRITESGDDQSILRFELELSDVDTEIKIGQRSLEGTDLSDDVVYELGQDNKLILLRREEDFVNVIHEMCRQASHSIRIYSPVLDHKLFDKKALRDVCSALARRNKYTFIQILLYDSHRVVKNGHALLEISRKLPSSINLKIVHPELRQLNHEYVLVDNQGLVYRQDHEIYDGYANFLDVSQCNRLIRQFSSAWESGLGDPNLRTLRI